MSNIDLTTTIHDLKELKQMQDELAAEITALEDRIKQHMTENDIDIINTADCRVTWKNHRGRFYLTHHLDHAILALTI